MVESSVRLEHSIALGRGDARAFVVDKDPHCGSVRLGAQQNALARAKEFDLAKILPLYENYYIEVIEKSKANVL